MIASSFNIDSLSKTDMVEKLLILGALLKTERYNEFSLLVQKLDFSDNTPDERNFLVLCIFTTFSESLLTNYTTSSHIASALLQLFTVISPDAVLAHKTCSETVKQQELITLDYASVISPSVRGTVFSRENFFGPGSRKSEIGYRIQSSLASQNWDILLLPVMEILSYSSLATQDFVIVDVGIFWSLPHLDQRHDIIARLRLYFRKIIIFDPDPWTGLNDNILRSMADHIDYIWGFTPDWSLTKEPCFRGRSILFPNIGGFEYLTSPQNINLNWSKCTFNFTGSVQGFNLNRVYWILEAVRLNLPIEIIITNPGIDDGLDCEHSLLLYIQKLAASHASLNLATRRDGSRMLTGRAIEVISLNRLLLQEYCPALHQYYIEDEHFIEFKDIKGLTTCLEFLTTHPKIAQTICSQGHQFYQERYSCKKMVDHFQTLL